MLNRPAKVFVALQTNLTNFTEAVRPFADKGSFGDLFQAGVVDVELNVLNVICHDAVEFKVGALSETGEVKVSFRTTSEPLLYRRRTSSPRGEHYAHGHPIEVFNAPTLAYFEVESHSPLAVLRPGKAISLVIDESLTQDTLRFANV